MHMTAAFGAGGKRGGFGAGAKNVRTWRWKRKKVTWAGLRKKRRCGVKEVCSKFDAALR